MKTDLRSYFGTKVFQSEEIQSELFLCFLHPLTAYLCLRLVYCTYHSLFAQRRNKKSSKISIFELSQNNQQPFKLLKFFTKINNNIISDFKMKCNNAQVPQVEQYECSRSLFRIVYRVLNDLRQS